jgi:phospholipase C
MGTSIKHIFVLVMENRSFDHMLGASTGTVDENGGIHPGAGVDAATGVPTTVEAPAGQVNAHNGTTFTVRAGAPFVLPVDPPHEFCDVQSQLASTGISGMPRDDHCDYSGVYPPLTMGGFVGSYANQAAAEGNAAALADLGAVMACYTAQQLPVLSTLARQFAVCDHWFSALPGPTWPNRFFLHAASSGGLDRSPTTFEEIRAPLVGYRFEHGTIFDALDRAELAWRVYHGDLLPQVSAIEGMSLPRMFTNFRGLDHLADDLGGDFAPAYVFIEPSYGHVLTHGGNFQCGSSQHPIDDVTRGEALIKYVYESIRRSPHWASSLLVITYDEHGGFFDHVLPQPAVPPGDRFEEARNRHGFRFDRLGVRVPAVIVSPWVPLARAAGPPTGCNLIDHTQYDHTSLLATVERLYGLPPLTARDAAANDVTHLLTAATIRDDAPWMLPDPADSGFSCGDDEPPGVGPGERVTGPGPPSVVTAATPPDAGPAGRTVTPTLRGFVELAAIHDARLHPAARVRIARRAAAIDTVGAARDYLTEVTEQLRAAISPTVLRTGSATNQDPDT